MMTCRTSPISPASMARRSCRAAGIEAAVERQHDAAVAPIDLIDGGVGFGNVEIDRLLAQHGLAHLHGMQHQADMGIGRRADDNGIDIGTFNHRHRVKRGLATQMIGQASGRVANRISNRDKLCMGIGRHIGRMDFPNSSSTKNRNAQHVSETPVDFEIAAALRHDAEVRWREGSQGCE